MRDLNTTECGQDTSMPAASTPNTTSTIPTLPLNFVKSGQKVVSKHGFNAIKNGIKTRQYDEGPLLKKPDWLKIRPPAGDKYQSIKALVDKHSLSTVCQEAMCPNIAECWSSGTATLMLMGSVCTRACKFCAVDTGNPKGWLDKDEPAKVADAVSIMGLKYVVLTSVNRDDLEDGGAQHYADCVKAIKAACPDTAVEVLTPDFQGVEKDIALLLDSGIEVFAQNIETVERLTHPIRDNRAGYQQTLSVLAFAKAHHPKILTKTSILLGMGETDDEILKTLEDLKAHQVDIVTLGQYMRPTLNHWPVNRYVSLEDFERYRQMGLAMGFLEVVSGPLVRSSYRAEQVLQKNNVGLDQ